MRLSVDAEFAWLAGVVSNGVGRPEAHVRVVRSRRGPLGMVRAAEARGTGGVGI